MLDMFYIVILGLLLPVTNSLRAFLVSSASSQFDIHESSIASAISSSLGTSRALQCTEIQTIGNNGGIWEYKDVATGSYIAKWRPMHYSGIEEVSNLMSLFATTPGLWEDSDVVAPHVILDIQSLYGYRLGYLLLAKKANGDTLSSYIFRSIHDLAAAKSIMLASFNIGAKLRQFHARYRSQHGDLHTSNIIIDDLGNVQFIDISTTGKNANSDLTYLLNNLKQLQSIYGNLKYLNWYNLQNNIQSGYFH